VEVKTGAGPNEDAEKKMLRVFSILQDEPFDVVPTFLFRLPQCGARGHAAIEEYVKGLFGDLFPRIRKRKLAYFADLAWDAEGSHHPWFLRYLGAVRAAGIERKIHADGMYPFCGHRDGSAEPGRERRLPGARDALGGLDAGGFSNHGDSAAVRLLP